MGIEAILDTWDTLLERGEWPTTDLRWIAYPLATAHHETAKTFIPCREWGRGQGHRYGERDPETGQVYYGRGFVQLTWRDNYALQERKLGLALVDNPDLALEPAVAARILLRGMADGDFTRKALADFFTPERNDPDGARAIVNGTDQAAAIATYHAYFLGALRLALPNLARQA